MNDKNEGVGASSEAKGVGASEKLCGLSINSKRAASIAAAIASVAYAVVPRSRSLIVPDFSRPLIDKKLEEVVLSRPFASIELISSGSRGCSVGLDELLMTGLAVTVIGAVTPSGCSELGKLETGTLAKTAELDEFN